MEQFHPIPSIIILEQPPEYAFPGEWFEMQLALEKGGATTKKNLSDLNDLNLQTSVHFLNGQVPTGQTGDLSFAKLVVDSSTLPDKILRDLINGEESKLRCKIQGVVSDNAAIKVSIRLLLVSDHKPVSSIFTHAIYLVKYKLWVDPNDWEDVWYRDEGGRDNCMLAQVQLRQADGSIALGDPISFHLSIHYDDADSTRVEDQSILSVIGGYDQIINQGTGAALISFRVEDLSKNHQGHDFKLLISADSTRFDIAPVFSPEFTVRSQPYKQRRLNPDIRPSTEAEDQKSDSHGTSSQSRAQGSLSLSHGAETHAADNPSATSALYNVIGWAHKVVDDLSTLQWKVVGYETNPDGTVDYSTPVYDSSNPNEAISKLISTFSSTVKEDLQVLVADVVSSHHSDTTSSILQGAISKSHTEGSVEDLESQFTYLLVKEYSSIRTRKVLGFPAFDEDKYVIGFFNQLTPTINTDHFIPIEKLENDFDHADQTKAAHILTRAIECHSKACYCISNYQSLQSLLENVSSDFETKIKSA